ncbi:MAG TPA: methionyl-tRNA formyltransferase [Flavitalea sp.]|nr:methionyl-tRNA formyltransferase [Flavitalea sp.]
MNLNELRIVFMGTPDFAVASLDALFQANCNIVGVITAPDKPAGRGMKLSQSPVKQYALEKNLHILQPEKLKNPVFLEELKLLEADVQVVVAFRMLPEVVWNMPPMGTINVHASLLPNYRGAAPINWAIINGEKETGVTTFKLQQEIDTGHILLKESLDIGDSEDVGSLYERLKKLGAKLIVRTMEGLVNSTLNETPQEALIESTSKVLHHAPKIFTETCKIDWTKPANEVFNLIRGLSPYPGAFTFINDKMLKIFSAEKIDGQLNANPGTYDTDGKSYLRFSCHAGKIDCKEIQLEGKKRMHIEEFLRGNKL